MLPRSRRCIQPAPSHIINVEGLSERLDGLSRPGHFRGVATVVAKLFNAAEPDLAFFGQKDAAQVAVLRRMVTDLRLATKIVVCPIVREPDGLALSSRNIYLSPAERAQALILDRTIRHVESLVAAGERRASALIAAAREIFATEPAVRVDYIELVDWDNLQPIDTASPGLPLRRRRLGRRNATHRQHHPLVTITNRLTAQLKR